MAGQRLMNRWAAEKLMSKSSGNYVGYFGQSNACCTNICQFSVRYYMNLLKCHLYAKHKNTCILVWQNLTMARSVGDCTIQSMVHQALELVSLTELETYADNTPGL